MPVAQFQELIEVLKDIHQALLLIAIGVYLVVMSRAVWRHR